MRKKISFNVLIGLIVLAFCVATTLSFAKENVNDKKTQKVAKTTDNDLYRPFLINNILNWYGNTGDGSYNPNTLQSGFEYPKGSGKYCTFEDGVVWGGFHKGRSTPKVGGSTYWRGLQAGVIVTQGTASTDPVGDNPDQAKYRPYTVRHDITPNTPFTDVQSKLESEAAIVTKYSSTTAQKLYNIYIQDWNEWPAKSASNPTGLAPFKDVNGDGLYEPNIDIPGQPGADETLYFVANDCDPSITTAMYGSPVIGLEYHRTIWAYNLPGALGNTIFESNLIINKSGAPVDSTYMVQWADVDDGDANDDYAGCDQARGLGFTYNGKASDATYGTAVPATGYTFFQGPRIATGNDLDSSVFRLNYRHGYKNLGMTTFVFFINGSTIYVDPPHGTGGDEQWYRLMNGLISGTGAPFIDPNTNQPTKFTLNGDPVAGTGWIDGTHGLIPGDRRQCQVTGPFTLANGDTQEVVVAHLVGLGGDRISSIAVMKWYSDLAQFAYNSLFNIPVPPPAPKVSVALGDGEVSLSWGDATSYPAIESFNSTGYAFEGYNVYQLPDNGFDKATAKLLATYDKVDAITTVFDDQYDASTGYIIKKPVQFGTDSDLKRRFVASTDVLGSKPLADGSTYYFAVTSYSVNADPLAKPTNLESSPQVLTVIPQQPKPGTRPAPIGDTLKVTQIIATGGSTSDGSVIPIVVDPNKTTGHQYQVTFHVVQEQQIDDAGDTSLVDVTLWNLTDVTLGKVLLADQRNQTGDENYTIIDGLMLKVTGPAHAGVKSWSIVGTRHFSPVQGFAGLGLEGFSSSGDPTAYDVANGTIGYAGNLAFGGIGTTVKQSDLHNVQLRLAAVNYNALWDPKATPTDANFSRSYRYLRAAASAAAADSFKAWIINPVSGYPYQGYDYSVPFSAWDMDVTPPKRLAVGNFENNVVGGRVDGRYWPWNASDAITNSTAREFCFIFNSPYTGDTPASSLQVNMSNNASTPLMYVMTCAIRNTTNWVAGDMFNITASKLNTTLITYAFAAPAAVTVNNSLAAADVAKINVFPNPYIGFNPQEKNKYERFVTFSHLPAKATIRIFNLAGVLVRTLAKNTNDQFFQWDLKNGNGFPVAAGMYVAYIDMPDIGKTKTLKLGIIPEQQFIDRW